MSELEVFGRDFDPADLVLEDIRAILEEPFAKEDIFTREGAGGKQLSYVHHEKIMRRLTEATEGRYNWEVVSMIHIPTESITGTKRNGEVYAFTRPAYWTCHGRLTILGLGHRDGIGTQSVETEDAPKGAETDSLKRAAMKFGLALHLYEKDEEHPPRRSSGGGGQSGGGGGKQGGALAGTINDTDVACPVCHCPPTKKHASNCTA